MIKRSLTDTAPRTFPCVDLILFLLLAAFGTWVIVSKPLALDPASAAGLSGALYGGAALLLGNWINRVSEWRRTTAETAHRIAKLKALIAVELVDVAIGLIEAKRLMDAAIVSLNAGGSVPQTLDTIRCRPRPLPLTESFGSDLLVLEVAAIDALVMLRANLTITRQTMDGISLGGNFGLLTATELSNGLAHDMTLLSKAVEHIAPERKLAMRGTEPDLLTELLRRAASPSPPSTP